MTNSSREAYARSADFIEIILVRLLSAEREKKTQENEHQRSSLLVIRSQQSDLDRKN